MKVWTLAIGLGLLLIMFLAVVLSAFAFGRDMGLLP